MIRADTAQIVTAVNGKAYGTPAHICGVSTDTRSINRGKLFIALKGENFDGNRFADQAFEKGAVAVITDDKNLVNRLPGKRMIVVDNSLHALQALAGWHRKRIRGLKVIAVTGSNGKTTVKEMIYSALDKKYRTLKTEGNLNNHIGLPLTLLKLNQNHQRAVLEMGMSGKGEILLLGKIAEPDIAVITNVSSAHMGGFGSTKDIACAKGEILQTLGESGRAVLNRDDPFFDLHVQMTKNRYATFGNSAGATVRVKGVTPGKRGRSLATFLAGKKTLTANIRLLGHHNVINTACAMAASKLAGAGYPESLRSIARIKPAPRRMVLKTLSNGALLIDDCYNANPASMVSALTTFAGICHDRGGAIFVMGDMLELGQRGGAEHREIGDLAGELGIKMMVVYGKLSHLAGMRAQKKGVQVICAQNHAEAVGAVEKNMDNKTSILVKGSRGMRMEKIVDALVLWRVVG